MKKIIFTLFLFSITISQAQYCLFFDFKAEEPEMVLSSIKGMMESDWGKNMQATKSLFAYTMNGTNQATHQLQFCFPTEEAFENAFISWGQSSVAQLLQNKLEQYSVDVRESLNTPIWYNGEDWAEDNVFMIYEMKVSDPGSYLKEFQSFSKKIAKKLGFDDSSYGLALPIVGKNEDFTHFVWIGAPDIKTSLSNTKKMYSDSMFAEFSKKVNGVREVINTTMIVRLMDF